MKKIFASLAIVGSLLSMGSSVSAEEQGIETETKIELTEEQKGELGELYQEIFTMKKEVIDKYVEFGVFSEEKGEKIKSHMDLHFEKLEGNHFLPKWDKHKPHHNE
ncbi:YckD family protein [Bacillus alkalicellulosilyticus]|uniref:YckD family protein n=1 Tax=Alkalihalobacterium alkalicellulosilyticum TaxID=1912214 RepID=UPI000996D68C|nr:YckD family protein [Bacillus alkalicellulosilyticus]